MCPVVKHGRTYTEEDASDDQNLENSTSEPMDLPIIVSVCTSNDHGGLILLQIVLSGSHFEDDPGSQPAISDAEVRRFYPEDGTAMADC